MLRRLKTFLQIVKWSGTMPTLKNTIEILKILDKSNCRECGFPTCLAFAAAVFKGQKTIDKCTHLDKSIIEEYSSEETAPDPPQDNSEPIDDLREKLREIDFEEAAKRLGAKYSNGRLTIKVCGKDFSVDKQGNFYSEIHIHTWITIPMLNYIIHGAGKPPVGEWISFRELERAQDWYNFFVHQCEKPLKKIADSYTDLFEDMLHIFNGKRVKNHYESDISLVLHPLPRVPMLICYWKPEDGLGSSLNLFFDKTANDNINVESIYSLGTGLVTMFEKVARRHGA
jgi:hypothetical protein